MTLSMSSIVVLTQPQAALDVKILLYDFVESNTHLNDAARRDI